MKNLDQADLEQMASGRIAAAYGDVLAPMAKEILRHRERALHVSVAPAEGDLSDFEIETFMGLSGGNSVLRRALVEIQRRRCEAP